MEDVSLVVNWRGDAGLRCKTTPKVMRRSGQPMALKGKKPADTGKEYLC